MQEIKRVCGKIVNKQNDLKYVEVFCVKFLWWLDKIEKKMICEMKKKDIIKQEYCLLVQDEIRKY